MSEPDLSVVMPMLDAANTVEAALASVFELADGLLEVIVIDDGSTDGSSEIASKFDIRLFRNEVPVGPGPARQFGVEQARGSLIGFQDSDDIWMLRAPDPRRVLLESDDSIDGVVGTMQAFAENDGEYRDFLKPFHAPAVTPGIFRRESILRYGSMDTGDLVSEDMAWYLEARRQGANVVTIADAAVYYRIRPESLTRDRERGQASMLEVARRAVAARKEQAGE